MQLGQQLSDNRDTRSLCNLYLYLQPIRWLDTFQPPLLCCFCHPTATPANYLLTTAHNMVNLDALRAANPGKCCIPLPGGPAGVAYLNTDQYYAATKSDCTDALTAARYPVKAGFVWACGCKGGPCKGKGGGSSTVGVCCPGPECSRETEWVTLHSSHATHAHMPHKHVAQHPAQRRVASAGWATATDSNN